jgi:hypothetical protein
MMARYTAPAGTASCPACGIKFRVPDGSAVFRTVAFTVRCTICRQEWEERRAYRKRPLRIWTPIEWPYPPLDAWAGPYWYAPNRRPAKAPTPAA